MASIAEISRRTGFSTATVSRALDIRQCQKVRPETRAAIQKICREIGFAPQYAARALASGKSFSVGLVQEETLSPSVAYFTNKLFGFFAEQEYSVLSLPICGSDREQIHKQALQFVYSARVDGFILQDSVLSQQDAEALIAANVPFVVFSMPHSQNCTPGTPNVSVDSVPAIRKIKSLLGQRAANAALILLDNCVNIRIENYERIFQPQKYVIPRTRHYVFNEALSTYEFVLEHADFLLRHKAWICTNDRMAIGACHALQKLGLTPGRDIAVVGYDNIERNLPDAMLTTIDPPISGMSRCCVDMLIKMITHGKTDCANKVLKADVVVRKTT